ncbi:MAG: acetyl-CoA carboxylase biotin carboxyl carrier protein subunit [Candidatus Sericytochromatia bacterium]|nr:acetyl-CoA carboxylase biotin carboxyl carrier protein subunit [Candidatus Sericytochromatia bacterium]
MEIKSNMAGTILEVLVTEGESVEMEQDVICIESMKMQMFIASEDDGKVVEIKVTAGDFVNEGDVLIVLE